MTRLWSRSFAAAIVFFGLVAAAQAGPSDQLKELRSRIEKLQQQLTESEETKTEAADALRESERAISATNRRLFELGGQQRQVRQALRGLIW